MEYQYQFQLMNLTQLLSLIINDYREKKNYYSNLKLQYDRKLDEINADCRANDRSTVASVSLQPTNFTDPNLVTLLLLKYKALINNINAVEDHLRKLGGYGGKCPGLSADEAKKAADAADKAPSPPARSAPPTAPVQPPQPPPRSAPVVPPRSALTGPTISPPPPPRTAPTTPPPPPPSSAGKIDWEKVKEALDKVSIKNNNNKILAELVINDDSQTNTIFSGTADDINKREIFKHILETKDEEYAKTIFGNITDNDVKKALSGSSQSGGSIDPYYKKYKKYKSKYLQLSQY